MHRIYHLALRTAWERDAERPYRADSLATEDFIHCSHADQVARSANRFHADAADLLVLHIDPKLLASPLREEAASNGEWFPHIHGPLNRDAVVAVVPLLRDAEGSWTFSPG